VSSAHVLAGKNVKFVDLSKLPSKYRKQMAERVREQKEQQLMQQLQLQQQQQQQQAEALAAEGEGGGDDEEKDEVEEEMEGEELEERLSGGDAGSGIVGSVSGVRRGRLAGMLQRSLQRKEGHPHTRG